MAHVCIMLHWSFPVIYIRNRSHSNLVCLVTQMNIRKFWCPCSLAEQSSLCLGEILVISTRMRTNRSNTMPRLWYSYGRGPKSWGETWHLTVRFGLVCHYFFFDWKTAVFSLKTLPLEEHASYVSIQTSEWDLNDWIWIVMNNPCTP